MYHLQTHLNYYSTNSRIFFSIMFVCVIFDNIVNLSQWLMSFLVPHGPIRPHRYIRLLSPRTRTPPRVFSFSITYYCKCARRHFDTFLLPKIVYFEKHADWMVCPQDSVLQLNDTTAELPKLVKPFLVPNGLAIKKHFPFHALGWFVTMSAYSKLGIWKKNSIIGIIVKPIATIFRQQI